MAEAEYFTPPEKRTKNIEDEVMMQGKGMPIPWENIMERDLSTWLDHYAKSIDTVRDILIASILPTVAALMGPAKVKVPSKRFGESVNLMMICLCEPGAGKSSAFHHGCGSPVRGHVEPKNNTVLFVDDFTEKGLFNQIKSSKGHKAIIGKDEVSELMDKVLGSSRKEAINMEKLINLFDGTTWQYSKGDNSKRQSIDNPGVSIAGYSQPRRFYPLLKKLFERKDGGIDRLFVYQPMPHRCLARKRAEHIRAVEDSNLTELRLVYEDVYDHFHVEGDNPLLILKLEEDAQEEFDKFTDDIAVSLNKLWAEGANEESSPAFGSKDDRHVLRLAAVLHVFKDTLRKRLQQLPKSPPVDKIGLATIKAAIQLVSYFNEQQRVLQQLHVGPSKITKTNSIHLKVLLHKGPFAIVRSVQRSFTGNEQRPSAEAVNDVFKAMEEDGLGTLKVGDRMSVFHKLPPSEMTDTTQLEKLNITEGLYRKLFNSEANSTYITNELYNSFLDSSPYRNVLLDTYHLEYKDVANDV